MKSEGVLPIKKPDLIKVFKEIFWQFQLLLKCFRLGFISKARIEIHKQTPTLSTGIKPALSHDKCCPSAASAPCSVPAHTTKPLAIGDWELWKYHTKQFLERFGWDRQSFASQLSPQPAALPGGSPAHPAAPFPPCSSPGEWLSVAQRGAEDTQTVGHTLS